MSSIDEDFKVETRARLDRIESKVDTLLEFKWRIIGGAGVIGGLFSVAIALTLEWMKK